MFPKPAHVPDAIAKADDLTLISTLVVRQWRREQRTGTEEMRQEGEARIARAQAGARMLLGLPVPSAEAAAGQTESPYPSLTDSKKISVNAKKPRVPRPRLAKSVEREWGTKEGRLLLLGASMRVLGEYFGLGSHTSLYDVPLFNEKIRPLREGARTARSAGAWMERNVRDRHR
jgi:hypothetical protein